MAAMPARCAASPEAPGCSVTMYSPGTTWPFTASTWTSGLAWAGADDSAAAITVSTVSAPATDSILLIAGLLTRKSDQVRVEQQVRRLRMHTGQHTRGR